MWEMIRDKIYCGEEVVGVLAVGRESPDKRLEMVVEEGVDSFSGRANTGNKLPGLPGLWILGNR